MAKLSLTIGLILLLNLLSLFAAAPAVTAPDEVRWSQENIPVPGEAEGWVLAKGSDVEHLAMAVDGSLYAGVDGLTYTLYKSTDGGYNWGHTGNVTDAIVDIATAPDDASVIYYVTTSCDRVAMVSATWFSFTGSLNLSSIFPSLK